MIPNQVFRDLATKQHEKLCTCFKIKNVMLILLYKAFTSGFFVLTQLSYLLSNFMGINTRFNIYFISCGPTWTDECQKQPFRGVLSEKCSENVQQIYRGKSRPRCYFNKIAS